jgi:hypothetical protein
MLRVFNQNYYKGTIDSSVLDYKKYLITDQEIEEIKKSYIIKNETSSDIQLLYPIKSETVGNSIGPNDNTSICFDEKSEE